MSVRRLIVEADGGSRGNPGPAAYGAVVKDAGTGEVLAEVREAIGRATNNVAEYRGVIAGLAAAKEIDPGATVEARLDSKLVVEQMSGRWKIKNADLKPLAVDARRAFPAGRVTYTWVPREKNTHADRLVNEALDGDPSRAAPATDTKPEVAKPEAAEAAGAAAVPAPPARAMPEDPHIPRLYLVRHGQTADTAARRFAGGSRDGEPLDETGRWQAQAAAELLAGSGAATVVASPMLRTRQTAEPIAKRLGVDVFIDPHWREIDFGRWEGRAIAEVIAAEPDEALAYRESASVPAPGGESIAEMAARVAAALNAVFDAQPGRSTVVVTHSMPIRALMVAALGAPLESIHHLRPGPGSVTEMLHSENGLIVTGFNLT